MMIKSAVQDQKPSDHMEPKNVFNRFLTWFRINGPLQALVVFLLIGAWMFGVSMLFGVTKAHAAPAPAQVTAGYDIGPCQQAPRAIGRVSPQQGTNLGGGNCGYQESMSRSTMAHISSCAGAGAFGGIKGGWSGVAIGTGSCWWGWWSSTNY